MSISQLRTLVLAFGLVLTVHGAAADTVKAAVAANFTAAIKRLTPLFETQSGHHLVASFGATGQLYAQINNGAPFDVFLAADNRTPGKLVPTGLAVADSSFVYAKGQLALWSAQPGTVDDKGAVLKNGDFKKIALANAKTAPYGQAAEETLRALGLYDTLRPRFVTGENIAQTQQFIASGNVPLGFVALAQVYALPAAKRGSYWIVPEQLHTPIAQEAILLTAGKDNAAAAAFLKFLKSPAALAVIRELGYAAGD